jgi:DNA-binding transcriptional MerR regulator
MPAAATPARIRPLLERSVSKPQNKPELAADVEPELMGIAEVCLAFDVSPRTLRFYETKGLLAPRRLNGTRVYSVQDRARLARILRAKSLGTPLEEIKTYLDMYGRHGEGRIQQLAYLIDRTDAVIEELESKRAQLDATLAELKLINANSRKALGDKRRAKAVAKS